MTMSDEADDKAKKERSPSFPFISLPKAIERARVFAESHRRSAARLQAIATTWGYAEASSGLQQTVAALKAYGLLDDLGRGNDRKVQLSELAWRILQDARTGAKEAAAREAALRPRFFAEMAASWVPDRPSDAHCISELTLDRGFTETAAQLFLKVFDETISFAGLKDGDKLSETSQGAEIQVSGVEATARTGGAAPTVHAGAKEPFRLSIVGDRLTGAFDINSVEEAEKLVRAINAWKSFASGG